MAAALLDQESIEGLSPSSVGATISAPRTSALASRITSVLSTSFSDSEFRKVIETLDARGFENTAENRRNLTLDLQQEVIRSNAAIIKDFGQVATQLQRVGMALRNLQANCTEMRRHIDAANRETKPILDEANSVLRQKSQVEGKQALLKAFQTHFVLTEDEISTLSSTSSPVNESFFQTMTKAKRINQDSRLLLGGANERLGLEILEHSSKQLNLAYQKLFRWIQAEFKTLDLENPQIGSVMRRAIRILADRPQLFQSWTDAFAESREHILSSAFERALVGGADGSNPIDSQAHDPLRYVGDMLAWTHSATVSEREALEVLFIGEGEELAKGLKAGIENDPWSRRQGVDRTDVEEQEDEVFDGRKALSDLVSRNIAGVGRILRQKTEQSTSGHEDAVVAYRLANLITFYRRTFERLLKEDAAFLELLTKLEVFALHQFKINMRDHVASIRADLTQSPKDVSPPDFLDEALSTLKVLMASLDSSYASSSDKASDFEPILQEALDPFLNGCQTLSKQLPTPAKRDVFALNCLLAARSALSPYKFTADRVEIIGRILERHSEALVDVQLDFFLESSGLAPLVAAIQDATRDVPQEEGEDEATETPNLHPTTLQKLAKSPLFTPSSLSSISQTLDVFLPSALIDARENIRGLRSAALGRKVTEMAAERFCAEFEGVEGVVLGVDALIREGRDGDGEGEGREGEGPLLLRDVFPRTGEEVRVLLS